MLNIPEVSKGSPITADRENRIIGGVNSIFQAYGNIVLGPNGLSIPTSPNLQRISRMAFIVQAYGEEAVTYEVGDVVEITEQVFDNVQDGAVQTAVSIRKLSSTHPRTMAIVTTTIIGQESGGTVAISGTVMAYVKRPVDFPMADDELLQFHGVGSIGASGDLEFTLTFGMGVADILWEDTAVIDLEDRHLAIISFPSENSGSMHIEATSEESGGMVDFKFLDSTQTVRGVVHNLPVAVLTPCCPRETS